jgi:tetratricopeptide (TPR) repeat protein
MNGHATDEDMKIVRQLESKLDLGSSPLDDLLELGQLYIEPCHREGEAMRIFEAVLARDPNNADAKFWLAYCCLHYLMDPAALRRAAILLESLIQTSPKLAGAAYMLLAEVLDEEGNLTVDRKIELLEKSVALEPGWVHNRESLAWAYMEAGRFADALEQINRALTNVVTPTPDWKITIRNFEESITGRTGHLILERLSRDLEKIKAAMKGRNP